MTKCEVRNGRLFIWSVSRTTNREFALPAIDLTGSEYNLCDGRFHSYQPGIATNHISLGEISVKVFRRAFEVVLEWIASNATGEWSFGVEVIQSRGDICLLPGVYFADQTDAMMFKLSIQKKSICQTL